MENHTKEHIKQRTLTFLFETNNTKLGKRGPRDLPWGGQRVGLQGLRGSRNGPIGSRGVKE